MLKKGLEDEIVDWMREQVAARNADGAVVGLSGGIDSSVTAGLVKKAFPDNSLGVMLPAGGTITKDVEYAQKVAGTFDLDTIKVNMEEANDALESTFQSIDIEKTERDYWPQTKIPTPNPAEQNIQTRLRMMTLYYIAEKKNYVVMGTSNLSEIIAGYYTLHGDGATDMRPLGDLTKTEVWELADQIGVPQEIIDRPPTGGCRGDESDRDEKEFGIDYRTFDEIYNTIQEGGDLSQFDIEDVNRTVELIAGAKDKSNTPTFTR
ncbi:NAD(+) synthase [Halanaerobaculum tunisiense]